MKIYLHSIGCRLNQSEIETAGRQLLAAGHELVADANEADRVLVNTCAVTREASRDARRLARRVSRQNSAAQIVLTGCYATVAPAQAASLPGVTHVVPNQDKESVVALLDPAMPGLPAYDHEPILREFLVGHAGNTRAFVKVQDGCDNHCTFCITTVARGAGRSRRLGDVVAEIEALAKAGYQEAVLTGVHLGSYGRDLDAEISLAELVRVILADTDIRRLRLSSLEPWDIEPTFFGLWRDARLMPHLHLPLQSGSDRILRRMARRTRRAAYQALVAAARVAIADLSVTTDVIVGFPGETEQDHRESLAFVREVGFSRLHVFTYSARPGTAAADMDGQVPQAIRKERSLAMRELGESLSLAHHRRYEGDVRPVLWESMAGADDAGLRWSGYTDNYIRVTASGPEELFNRVHPVRLTQPRVDGMTGVLAD
jgi:threonylcarbamoyladenosine tRNA methylthiotransferase MtaB